MRDILEKYVAKFNTDDEEIYKQDIDNSNAMEWLSDNIPLIDIPDKTIEEIYYFRWWVFRKHIKNTEDGYVITEFLPSVPWGGRHNTIIAAAGHHIAEAKWLKSSKKIIEEYVKFWLEEKSNTYLYSSWLIYSLYEYCIHISDFSFGIDNLGLLINYYEKTKEEHKTDCGLFWSIDGNDAMEYSISGYTESMELKKGVRPTLNSYMAANALAISKFAVKANRIDLFDKYYNEYNDIKDRINQLLWDGGFYKAIHTDDFANPSINDVPQAQNVRELIGYIPWCFNLAPNGREKAFEELKLESGFKCQFGLTTAEFRHPRYLYEADHECLWNGYIWPFATSQTLNAVKNLLKNYNQNVITSDDFYSMLNTFAKQHYIIDENGKNKCWIDEVKSPVTNEWSSRKLLEKWGWDKERGGYERGKDYNHSSFCDIVLSGLLGIEVVDGVITVNPKIPDDWDYFAVENLHINNNCYKIIYDKKGNKYGYGKGLAVIVENREGIEYAGN